jgi:hypothetical protein
VQELYHRSSAQQELKLLVVTTHRMYQTSLIAAAMARQNRVQETAAAASQALELAGKTSAACVPVKTYSATVHAQETG